MPGISIAFSPQTEGLTGIERGYTSMSSLSPEEQEAIKDAPKGTFALMILVAVGLAAGWAFMFFFMFLQHGPVN